MKEEVAAKGVKQIRIRIGENLLNELKRDAKEYEMSLSNYMNLVLNASFNKEKTSFDEKVGKCEKKEIRSRVSFTESEIELLRQYASLNHWSVTKEIRYRVISSISKKPKLSKEELKAIYSVRSSVNVLGANINRLVRDSKFLSNDNVGICKELIILMKELKDKIGYLEKSSYSNFKLKKLTFVKKPKAT